MARERRSTVRKRRRGCLTGCLTKVILLLGVLALLLVGACVLGFVQIDGETGAPSLSLENVGLDGVDLSGLSLPEIKLPNISLPEWAYGVGREGLTVKTLRAGKGEAVLVCCDGYTMLLGGGDNGLFTAGQMLLCGVNRLSAAVAMSAEDGQVAGMPMAIQLGKPGYLIYPGTQTKTEKFNAMLSAAEGIDGLTLIAPQQGLTFSLGRSTVTIIGPAHTPHTDERDDGLSVRIDYGATSVLVLGTITAAGEAELVSSPANLDADALICARGGSGEATGARLVSAVSPSIAIMTSDSPSGEARARLENAGAKVYTAKEHGVITLVSDGTSIDVQP